MYFSARIVAALSRPVSIEVFGQDADDAVAAGVEVADLALVLAAGASITPQAVALMTAVTPPDCA